MKKLVLITALLAVATLTIQAQDTPRKTENRTADRQHRDHRESFNQLQLSEDQRTKMKSMNEEFHQQMEELKKKDDITVKDWKTKMETLRNDHRTKMQSLLTTDQKAKLQKMKDDHMALRKADREARAQKMKIRLGLTDDQAAKLKQNRTDMEAKMKTLHDNKSLTDDQRREQMKDLHEKQKESLKSILSPDQMKKMHEGRGDGRHDRGHKRGGEQI